MCAPASILTAKTPLARTQRSVDESPLRQTSSEAGESDNEANEETAQPARRRSNALVTSATPDASSRMTSRNAGGETPAGASWKFATASA